MFKKAVFPGRYIQGIGALGELPALIELVGKRALVLASPSTNAKVLPQCGIDLPARGIPIEVFRGECCAEELARVSGIVAQRQVDVLVGMGGGKTIDTAKIVASFGPNFIAVEPPELIGGDVSVTDARPEVISEAVESVHRVDAHIPVLCGAGVKNGKDVKKALQLGAKGVLLASGVIRSKDVRATLRDLVGQI